MRLFVSTAFFFKLPMRSKDLQLEYSQGGFNEAANLPPKQRRRAKHRDVNETNFGNHSLSPAGRSCVLYPSLSPALQPLPRDVFQGDEKIVNARPAPTAAARYAANFLPICFSRYDFLGFYGPLHARSMSSDEFSPSPKKILSVHGHTKFGQGIGSRQQFVVQQLPN